MVKEIRYTSINRVLDELMRHPMMADLTLEQAVSYTVSFIGINGLPSLYQDKVEDVEIEQFRGLLPCDLISINQVKDLKTGICLRSMTDNFPKGMSPMPKEKCVDPMNNVRVPGETKDWYIPEARRFMEEPSFKTQGRVIFTSFPEGIIEVSYKSIPVDDDGFPLLIDNAAYLEALKAYIKQEVFTIKFDMGNISTAVLQNAQREYCWAAGRLGSEFQIPSISEMESIARAFNTMIPRMREFDNGFTSLGDREYLRKH